MSAHSILKNFSRTLALVASLFLGRSGDALSVLPLSLEDLTLQAGRIFVGRCVEVSGELDERGWPSTYAAFTVSEGLKGAEPGQRVLIKQFGAPTKPPRVGEGESGVVQPKTLTLAGASYRTGAEYLLFLYPESDQGFTSPVGGGQGLFEVSASSESAGLNVQVGNPAAHRFLTTFREGPVPLEELTKAVRGLLR